MQRDIQILTYKLHYAFAVEIMTHNFVHYTILEILRNHQSRNHLDFLTLVVPKMFKLIISYFQTLM